MSCFYRFCSTIVLKVTSTTIACSASMGLTSGFLKEARSSTPSNSRNLPWDTRLPCASSPATFVGLVALTHPGFGTTLRFFGLLWQRGLRHMSTLRPMMVTLAKLLIASSAQSVLPQQRSKKPWLIMSGHARKWWIVNSSSGEFSTMFTGEIFPCIAMFLHRLRWSHNFPLTMARSCFRWNTLMNLLHFNF